MNSSRSDSVQVDQRSQGHETPFDLGLSLSQLPRFLSLVGINLGLLVAIALASVIETVLGGLEIRL